MSSNNDKGGRAGRVQPSLHPDSVRIDGFAANIATRLHACSLDELRVLDQLLARLEKGRESYGPLDLSKARDWDRDLAEELLDVQVYRAIGKVLARDAKVDLLLRDLAEPRVFVRAHAAPPGVLLDWEMPDPGDETR